MDELKNELEALQARAYELENNENEEEYNEFINDTAGDVEILGMTYQPARVLEEVDPTAYRCGHTDYNDSLLSEVNDEIDAKQEEIDNFND